MKINNIDYHITDNCNLKCVSCSHFCPLVPEGTPEKPIEQVKSDLLLLSKFRDMVDLLSIMGGEPTLHSRLNEILDFARQCFPFSQIELVTNGLKYKEFHKWKDTILKNNIKVVWSPYPFKEDYRDIFDYFVANFPNNFRVAPGGDEMIPRPFENKKILPKDGSLDCRLRCGCTQLLNGRLYICNYAAQLKYLKKYFGDAVKVEQANDDYIDLNEATPEAIEKFIQASMPTICQYCREPMRGIDKPDSLELVPWKISDKDINEWIKLS